MKSKTITLFCFLLSSITAFGTHNVAGNITFERIDTKTISAVIHTYTNPSAVAADRDSLTICWGDGQCEVIGRTFKALQGPLQHNGYTYEHTYDDFGTYTISMTDPNRTGGILNVNFPGSENVQFHLQTEMVLAAEWNNSPVLLLPPIDVGFVGLSFFHNPNAFDAEGDSLAYKSIVPMQNLNMDVPNYRFPNEIPVNSGNTYSINETTGTILWDSPAEPGSYVVAMVIEEYRNGQKISSMVRDMEIRIEPMGLVMSPPNIVIDENVIMKEAGETVSFDVTFEDLDSDIKISATGGPFEVENPAIFNAPVDFTVSPVTVNFEWKTNPIHARDQAYQVVFKATDKDGDDLGSMTLKVVEIFVDGDASIIIIDSLPPSKEISYWPNPANDMVSFNWDQRKITSEISIEILNEKGQVLKADHFENRSKSRGVTDIGDLLPGIYFVKIVFDDEVMVKKLIVH